MLIGIRFADNDFRNTVCPFLQLFINSRFIEYQEYVTKARIVELFNMLTPGLYWLCQNGYQHGLEWKPETYLRIKEENVYLGEECVTAYIEKCNSWDNCEFHYVDTEQKQVYSI
jgi:hypothetical protein